MDLRNVILNSKNIHFKTNEQGVRIAMKFVISEYKSEKNYKNIVPENISLGWTEGLEGQVLNIESIY